jgi:hypothetical protein
VIDETLGVWKGRQFFKMFPIISHLNNRFQGLPNRDILIDESLALWKGCLSFKQYLTVKASKFGIKTSELCDTSTGYLWSFLVYAGKDTELDSPLITADTNKITAIVLKLVEPLLKQGRTVWMGNFYISPCLATILKTVHESHCIGTLKLNQKNVPKKVKDTKRKKGEIIGRI